MPVMTKIPDDHPMMVAWNAYMESEEFANSKRWAINPDHTEGSLWASFMAGFNAAHGKAHDEPLPYTETD
jgi:hypothetical protein